MSVYNSSGQEQLYYWLKIEEWKILSKWIPICVVTIILDWWYPMEWSVDERLVPYLSHNPLHRSHRKLLYWRFTRIPKGIVEITVPVTPVNFIFWILETGWFFKQNKDQTMVSGILRSNSNHAEICNCQKKAVPLRYNSTSFIIWLESRRTINESIGQHRRD